MTTLCVSLVSSLATQTTLRLMDRSRMWDSGLRNVEAKQHSAGATQRSKHQGLRTPAET